MFLFWLVYKDQPWDKIIKALEDANYFWIFISLILGILSHVSRAMRWRLLILPLGFKLRRINAFFAVMVMYLSNTAIPRSGEIARCGVIKKYEKVPFSKLLGTVVVERVFDFVILFLMLLIALISQYKVIIDFLNKNTEIVDKFSTIGQSNNIIISILILILFLLLFFVFRNKIKTLKIYEKILQLLKNFFEGIKTVKDLDRKWEFIAHSIFIWLAYFLVIYITFLAFEFTSHLSLLSGLMVFVMASFGMVAPSPGGIGTWHFMTIETLVLYGVAKSPDASAFAFATHGLMTLTLVIGGLISLVLLPLVNKNDNLKLS